MPDVANGDQIATGLFTPVLKFTVPGHGQVEVAAVADHIGDALDDPGSAYPTKNDKNIPGGDPLDPMHRLVPGYGVTERDRYRRQPCNRLVHLQQHRHARPSRRGRESRLRRIPLRYEGDEYLNDFSVRYINPTENQEAGRRLGAWYDNDRILSHDPYIIRHHSADVRQIWTRQYWSVPSNLASRTAGTSSVRHVSGEVKGPLSLLNIHCHRIPYMPGEGSVSGTSWHPPSMVSMARTPPGSRTSTSSRSNH
ncbi:hypothetical protein [Streptomyces sp. NPDC127039]|uniref:hypothetical protein n=1 Tax=Streptomyces sp. NPDC127039 TaxID=3347115 RepID=UPI003646A042